MSKKGSFLVWPENRETVLLFWAVRRCWLIRPMGGVMGMNWAQIDARLRHKVRSRAALAREMDRLQLMEEAILEEMHGE